MKPYYIPLILTAALFSNLSFADSTVGEKLDAGIEATNQKARDIGNTIKEKSVESKDVAVDFGNEVKDVSVEAAKKTADWAKNVGETVKETTSDALEAISNWAQERKEDLNKPKEEKSWWKFWE